MNRPLPKLLQAASSTLSSLLQFPSLIQLLGVTSAASRVRELRNACRTARSQVHAQSQPPSRTAIINAVIATRSATRYLEIGVRNPADNFDKVQCETKHSVDPGVEFKDNPVDFKMTSDEFFGRDEPTSNDYYDVIFIDGLHLAGQVERDILNAVKATRDGGVIILHDCLPPSHHFAREDYGETLTPASGSWSGTTWKAFWRFAFTSGLACYCVPSDYGVGIIDTSGHRPPRPYPDPFFEFSSLRQITNASGMILTLDELLIALDQEATG